MNKLTATVEFDFKGKHHQLSSEIDIDKVITHEDFYNSVYLSIANNNNIGLYTYELEIMMDQEITFSNAKGCSIGCIDDGLLNLDALRDSHNKHLCQPIITDLINKYDLNTQDNVLINALTDAYLQGKG